MSAQAPKPFTLSDAASVGRATIKYGAILIAFLILGRMLLNISIRVYKVLNPPKPPGPTYGFGTLPDVTFPTSTSTIDSYTLETKDGSLPALAPQLPVFFIPVNKVNLFSMDRAKQLAATLGFVFPPEQVSSTVYRWKRTTPLPSVLDIDIVTQNFSMKTSWANDPNYLAVNKSLPTQSIAINDVRNLLKNTNLMGTDMATGEARITYLKASGTGYATAVSQSEADFMQLDLFRSPIKGLYPVLRPNPSQGSARFIFSGNQTREQRIVEMEYQHAQVDYDRPETYGLIGSLEAWKRLQAGKGFVAYIDEGVTKAIVRNVTLGYFDADTPQSYLQPIYIFTGDNNFFGYVSAVAPLTQAQSSGDKSSKR